MTETQNPRPVLYTKPGCFPCRKTLEKFRQAGIEVQVEDLSTNAAALEYVTEELGYSQAPVVVVDDTFHWSGTGPGQHRPGHRAARHRPDGRESLGRGGKPMTGQNNITVIGNVTAVPQLHTTRSGRLVANFTIASTPRTFDEATGQWVDGETVFLKARLWGQGPARNAIASLMTGTRVLAHGILTQRSYQGRDGQQRTVHELDVEDIGISLRYHHAVAYPTPRIPPAAAPPAAAPPAGRHPVDELAISPRPLADDNAWFGTLANPAGTITPTQDTRERA